MALYIFLLILESWGDKKPFAITGTETVRGIEIGDNGYTTRYIPKDHLSRLKAEDNPVASHSTAVSSHQTCRNVARTGVFSQKFSEITSRSGSCRIFFAIFAVWLLI